MQTFKEYWLDDLKATVKRRTIYSKEYEHAAKALYDAMKGKNLRKKGILGHAWDIAKRYAHVEARELEKYFREKYGITEPRPASITEARRGARFYSQCELYTMRDIKNLERKFDQKFSDFDIDFRFTKHFADRVSDNRNDPCITLEEIENLFNRLLISKKMGRKLFSRWKDLEFVLNDVRTDINIPFAIEYDEKNDNFVAIAKTIMRKKDFKSKDAPIIKT